MIHATYLLCILLAQHEALPAANAESGTNLFRRNCSSCHGKGGEGGRAPSLTGRLRAGDTDSDMARVVAAGIPGTEMPAYEARLGTEKIARIVSYVRSVKRNDQPVTGNAARGESVFWGKGGCSNCHAVGNRGNRVGPDLSRIGRQRSTGYLRDSLLKPDSDILANYIGVTVVTGDGKTVRGIERALNEFSVVLQDFSGKVHSFSRESLKSAGRDTQSLMPAYSGEVDDLLAYLLTLTAEVKR
jgi:putative heme-binding domain-containing protein